MSDLVTRAVADIDRIENLLRTLGEDLAAEQWRSAILLATATAIWVSCIDHDSHEDNSEVRRLLAVLDLDTDDIDALEELERGLRGEVRQ